MDNTKVEDQAQTGSVKTPAEIEQELAQALDEQAAQSGNEVEQDFAVDDVEEPTPDEADVPGNLTDTGSTASGGEDASGPLPPG